MARYLTKKEIMIKELRRIFATGNVFDYKRLIAEVVISVVTSEKQVKEMLRMFEDSGRIKIDGDSNKVYVLGGNNTMPEIPR